MAQATKPLLHEHERLNGTPAPLLKPSLVAHSLGAVGGGARGRGRQWGRGGMLVKSMRSVREILSQTITKSDT